MPIVRLQFDFSEEAAEHLTALQARVEANSRADVIKNAFWLYEWLVENAEQGRPVEFSVADLRKMVRLK